MTYRTARNQEQNAEMIALLELWKNSHGTLRPVAYTEISPSRDCLVVVSTVIASAGHTIQNGFFRVFETKVFGDGFDEFVLRFHSCDGPREASTKALGQHSVAIQKVIDHCWPSQ